MYIDETTVLIVGIVLLGIALLFMNYRITQQDKKIEALSHVTLTNMELITKLAGNQRQLASSVIEGVEDIKRVAEECKNDTESSIT